MQSKGRDLQGCAVLVLALLGGAFILIRNAQAPVSYTIPGPTPTVTQVNSAWEEVIQGQFINAATPLPTRELPANLEPPTIPAVTGTPVLLQPTQLFRGITPTVTRFIPITATRPGPTAVPSPTGLVTLVADNPREGQFSPPPEQVPLSLDPRDHFWFNRPVDSSSNSTSLYWYPYGSDGPQNTLRVHHGLDMPNPIGKPIRAAGPGVVIWAADRYVWRENGVIADTAYSYGNVVIIEHDFGYQGEKLYTLYAHLSAIIVKQNDRVQKGDAVGLSGASGQVSGPHVHFEVRVSRNNYFDTRNPILWMAPYLNHGVIAGRVLYRNGQPVEDASVSLYEARRGRIVDTTSTYVHPRRPGASTWNVNPDDVWGENFVFGDVPAGEYQVVVTYGGNTRMARDVTVLAATTSFIDLGQLPVNADSPNSTQTPTQ